MDDSLKLTVSLTFEDDINEWISDLARKASKDRKIVYRAGSESIPHLTIVQGLFEGKKRNGKTAKSLTKKIEELILEKRLLSRVPDLVISSKSTWTSTSASGVFTGLHVLNDTDLQSLNDDCVKIIQALGGNVTSAYGFRFTPHVTLALLQPGETPRDIFEDVKENKVLHSPKLIVGRNGIGGSLIKVHSEPLKVDRIKGAVKRNSELGKR